MVFEVGKYYRHASGKEIHVVGGPFTTRYYQGPVLACESLGCGTPSFVGVGEDHAQHWTECEPWISGATLMSASMMEG